MIVYPAAKINIGLHIARKRPDGYHDIKTLMVPVPAVDILEIIPSDCNRDMFCQTGITLPGNPDQNLVLKAVRAIRRLCPIPFVSIHLHKLIPPGAGLGGGSSDAAATLNILNMLFELRIPVEERLGIAAGIGSDCPFFMESLPAIATGRGEILEKFTIDLTGYYLVLVIPAVHVSTAEAYQGVQILPSHQSLKTLLATGPETWKDTIVNDFEISIFAKYPLLRQIKEMLYARGAVYASMSGSGSALYGLFQEDISPEPFRHLGDVRKLML